MKSFLRLLLLLCALAAGPAVQAARIAGVDFAERARVGGSELLLNGVGVRQVAWLKGYAAGLYLAQKARSAPEALATPGAKRIRLNLLVEVEAKEFVKAVDKGMRRNHTPAELAALQARIDQFDAQILALKLLRKNEVIDIDFVPGTGLVLLRNGQPQGTPLPGDDLYAGVMKIFIGRDPVDEALKAGLLGGT